MLSYDELTGELTRMDGKLATHKSADGYLRLYLGDVTYPAHRVVWKWIYNEEPEEIDHKDTVRSNNAKLNLRKSDRSTNMMNRCLNRNSTTGVKGLSINRERNGRITWRGLVQCNGVKHRKDFPYTEEGREEAVDWIRSIRLETHKQFTNHG